MLCVGIMSFCSMVETGRKDPPRFLLSKPKCVSLPCLFCAISNTPINFLLLFLFFPFVLAILYITDLSVFHVEVDPKRIEALENEDPPPYEPTGIQPDEENDTRHNGDDDMDRERLEGVTIRQENDAEIVEENAEEERLTGGDGGGMDSGHRKSPSSRTTSGSQEHTTTANRPSLWPADEIAGDGISNREYNADSTMGIFPDGDHEQPNMDDFFHDQYDGPMDDEEEDRMDTETIADKTTASPALAAAAVAAPIVPPPAQTEKGTPQTISKKPTAKAKRPKIRPSVRKMK